MSLPVSQYEALLAEVRGLRRKAQRVQQLARPLIGQSSQRGQDDSPLDYTMEFLKRQDRSNSPYERAASDQDHLSSEDEFRLGIPKGRSTGQMSVSSEPVTRASRQIPTESMYHGAWPNVTRTNMWNSEPTSLGQPGSGTPQHRKDSTHNDVGSVMSFASSSGGVPIERVLGSPEQKWASQQLEAKMDVVNSLLSMLGSQEHVDMGETLLALSTCPESCLAMRQSGCIPLLVQLVQSDKEDENRKKAAQALHNLVNSQPDERIRKREVRILKLLEEVRRYVECLKYGLHYEVGMVEGSAQPTDDDKHPVQTVAHLMKLSFDEGHRQAICQLGGIHTVAALVEIEHSLHGSQSQEGHCILMRRYACMALTNLTFGDSGNKTLLCSLKEFMKALVAQLHSPSDELRQVTASVLRNLSWRADSTSKEILRETGSVTGLMKAAMLPNKENTLKSILSALWNLSAHCTENKSEICAVDGSLAFIVNMLTYKTPSKSLAIIENAGGILRNISSQIAVRDDYRAILRRHDCLHILLDQLKSPSLTIVSNACGTLWNLSAKNAQDQDALWQMGAPAMLRSLNHSKHKMIAMGSSAALKNLLSCRPQSSLTQKLDSTALALNLPELPTLGARKQKALMQDLDNSLSETCENIEKDSPVKSSNDSSADLTNAFASLNLNQPSTSYGLEMKPKPKLAQNYGGSSLPYVPQLTRRTNPASFLPVRTKFTDRAYEDDPPEQPIDYSQKYSETKTTTSKKIVKNDQKEDKFGSMEYTETDLDQPTDYSLRYAEDDSDSDICDKISKQEYVQDTVKTYCTEGTPYETPFVFSNATSMSDLRNVDEKPEINNDMPKTDSKDNKEIKNLEEKDRCSTEDISELEDTKRSKSEFSSGMMSPEKPVNYCEEGTPGYFSRVSSFGSGLDSLPTNQTVVKIEVKQEENENLDANPLMKMGKNTTSTPKSQNETKVVKFEQAVNYAEQTPLMFSRSSSLASLDSIEQHSIHDDRSSVVSDFSRLTSGIVSPSELPDSPTQTVPSSPRSSKQKLEFPSSSKLSRHHADNKQRVKSSVFEDNVTKFKEESTPIQFSTATSLSSLTIDDHDDDNTNSTKTPTGNRVVSGASDCSQIEQQEKTDMDKEKEKESSDDLNDDSEGDEDILAACISEGMQSNISAPTASSTLTKLPLSTFKYRQLPVRAPNVVVQDPPKTYCTEDTPAELSRVGSNSNLSTLTIPNDRKSKASDSSDDSSNLSAENENILAACIQSAMPKSNSDFKGPSPQPKLLASRSSRNSEEFVKMPPAYDCDYGRSASARIDMSRGKGRDVREAKFKEDRDRRRVCPASLPPYLAADEVAKYEVEDSPYQYSLRSSLSDLTVDGSVAGLKPSGKAGTELQAGPSKKPSATINVLESQRPDRESFSSTSSLASEEGALLEECIYSGMPIDKQEEALLNECIQAGMSINSNPNSRSGSSYKPNTRISPLVERRPIVSNVDLKSKNVNVASVARNTAVPPQVNSHRPETSTTAAGVEEGPVQQKRNDIPESPVSLGRWDPQVRARTGTDTLQDRLSRSGETCSLDRTRNGSSESGNQCLEGSFEGDFTYSNSDSCAPLAFTRSCEESGNLVDNRMLDPDAMIESLDRFTAELVSQASHLNKDKTSQLEKSKLSNNDDNSWTEMDTSRNEVTFPTISGSSPNVVTFDDDSVKEDVVDRPSDDFSSINTTTMTESTLIAYEATKIATVLRQEAEMTRSCSSVRSLNLDSVRPPSQLNSLTNSAIATPDKCPPKSPKLATRKRNLLVKRALSNSLNRASSRDSLEYNSMETSDCLEADNSIGSVASLPREELRNGGDNGPHPIFNVKQPFVSSGMNSLTADLEMVNPPSIFNEITDMCNSLADVPTEVIVTDTGVFEDCLTHVVDVDNTLQVDTSEFSDANSVTPLQTDISSAENSPKKPSKSSNKNMMSKQRRNVARDRYKTYVVAAEKVMQESIELESREHDSEDDAESPTEGDETVNGDRSELVESTADRTLTYTVSKSKKERHSHSKSVESKVAETTSSGSPSPTRTKLSIRRNFIQKRLENRERFKTQTLNQSTFGSPELLSASPPTSDIHSLVEKEANLVLKTIRDSKLLHDEMLDSETLSLVSNDEDSEQIGSIKRPDSVRSGPIETPSPLCTPPIEPQEAASESNEENSDEEKPAAKPKIVKPTESAEREVEEEPKGVRGRRKPLYSKTGLSSRVTPKTIKPAKTMAPSNLVKNVTSTFKSGAALKSAIETKPKVTPANKPPVSGQVKSSGYGLTRNSPGSNNAKTGNTSRNSSASNSPKHAASSTPPLERQGTFTKDDTPTKQSPSRAPVAPSKIPSFARQIGRTSSTKIPTPPASAKVNGTVKALSADRTGRNLRTYNRSTSADSREPAKKIQPSSSTQSLKNESRTPPNGALRKATGIPSPARRSNNNVASPPPAVPAGAKKQVTSKIASLWKRVEESKAKQQPGQDKRVWIQNEQPNAPKLIRSDTFEGKVPDLPVNQA